MNYIDAFQPSSTMYQQIRMEQMQIITEGKSQIHKYDRHSTVKV